MIKRNILIGALLLLLIVTGVAMAYSSSNFVLHRFTLFSGGTAVSSNYSVTAVIGQPATGSINGPNYTVSSGFLFPNAASTDPGFGLDNTIYLPLITR